MLNNDDAFEILTEGMDSLDIRNRLYFGKYDMADAFIMFNGYGNIETLHYTDKLFNRLDNDFIVWADENDVDLFDVSGVLDD
jgi:purine-nucleoside phosphorylase